MKFKIGRLYECTVDKAFWTDSFGPNGTIHKTVPFLLLDFKEMIPGIFRFTVLYESKTVITTVNNEEDNRRYGKSSVKLVEDLCI